MLKDVEFVEHLKNNFQEKKEEMLRKKFKSP